MFVMPSSELPNELLKSLANTKSRRAWRQLKKQLKQNKAQTIVTVGKLSSGFEMPGAKLLVHVEADLFDEAGAQTIERRGVAPDGRPQTADGRKRKKFRSAAFFQTFAI